MTSPTRYNDDGSHEKCKWESSKEQEDDDEGSDERRAFNIVVIHCYVVSHSLKNAISLNIALRLPAKPTSYLLPVISSACCRLKFLRISLK